VREARNARKNEIKIKINENNNKNKKE